MTSLASMYFSQINQRRFPFNQNFRKFGSKGKWYRNFPKKFPDIPETVEIRNAILSTENSRNFGSQVAWKENFGEKNFQKFGYTS